MPGLALFGFQGQESDLEEIELVAPEEGSDLFGANGGSRPSMASPTKMKTFWVIKYLNIYSTNK